MDHSEDVALAVMESLAVDQWLTCPPSGLKDAGSIRASLFSSGFRRKLRALRHPEGESFTNNFRSPILSRREASSVDFPIG